MREARDESNVSELALQGLWDIFNAKIRNPLHGGGAVRTTFGLSMNGSVRVTTELLYCGA